MLYNKHNLSVAKIASKSKTRPKISGVFFTPELTCATDSFRLIEITVDNTLKSQDYPEVNHKRALTNCPPFILPAEEVKKIKIPVNKNMPILQSVAIGGVNEQQVELMTTNLETGESKSVRRIQGRFPDYEKIFPQGKSIAEIVINGEYLAEIAKLIADLSDLKSVKIKFYGKDKPITLEGGNANQKARAMVMSLKE